MLYLPDGMARLTKGFRGEPWFTDGKYIYDRLGEPFAEVYQGCKEFARTIVLCVNLLTNVPLRPEDRPEMTDHQRYALMLLEHEARKLGDDPR